MRGREVPVERLARAAKARARAAIAEGAEDVRAQSLAAEGGSHEHYSTLLLWSNNRTTKSCDDRFTYDIVLVLVI